MPNYNKPWAYIGKLGCLPSKKDKRTLKLESYYEITEKPPASVRWDKIREGQDWGVMGNDKYGNCVIVTAAHMIDCAEANEFGEFVSIPDSDVINLSNAMGAMDGFTVLERLKWWKSKGMWGRPLMAYAECAGSHDYLKSVIHVFGAADIALWMARAWMGQSIWHTGTGPAYRPGSWGGHSVPLVGYEPSDKYGTLYKAVTWGKIVDITADAIDEYLAEAWASILPAWYEKDQISPSGFNFEQLKKDLERVSL